MQKDGDGSFLTGKLLVKIVVWQGQGKSLFLAWGKNSSLFMNS